MQDSRPTRLIVGITGATGAIFGVRLLQMLYGSGVETHLVMSKWAARTLTHETQYSVKDVQRMATESYPIGDQGPQFPAVLLSPWAWSSRRAAWDRSPPSPMDWETT